MKFGALFKEHTVYLPVKLRFSKNLDLDKIRKKKFLNFELALILKNNTQNTCFTLFCSVWWSDSTHVL